MDRAAVFGAALAAALAFDAAAGGPRGSRSEVCRACVEALPADGAAITLMSSDSIREPLCVSDPLAAEIERTQYALGEGPSLQAFLAGRPVLVPELGAASPQARWPMLLREPVLSGVGSLFVFPMRFGAISIGVCMLYRRGSGPLDRPDLAFVLRVIDLTMLALLELRGRSATTITGRPVRPDDPEAWPAADRRARNQVHQATGMLIAQLGVDAETAFARLRAEAFQRGIGIERAAGDIVARRRRLDPDQP